MKNFILIYVFACLFLTKPLYSQYDMCVYGASSAGVIAAYTAKKMGKSVVLIAHDGHVGGLTTGGLGATDIGKKLSIGGFSRDFYKQLGAIYGKDESWTFEPKAAKAVLDKYLKEANIPVVYNKELIRVKKKGNKIVSIDVKSTIKNNSSKQTIEAKVFMDCTYEGDLLAKSKVSYALGRESNDQYNERYNGYFLAKYRKASGYHQFPDNVSPYRIEGDPTSGLVWGVSKSKPSKPGAADKLIQAYNFRICLTDSAENMIPIGRPKDYDSTKYELLVRLFKAQPNDRKISQYFIWSKMPNRKTDVNNRGGFSTDMIGANYNWAEADYVTRKKIYEDHLSYTQGLLYFYQTDPRVPIELRSVVSKWGYPKDEYVDNSNFTPQLYIREGRRLIGEYVMTENNCLGKIIVDDPIGMASYPMDSHNTQRIVVNGMVKNEGNVEVKLPTAYSISYRSIIPKEKECTNLLVPVCLSSSHIAFGSIRMEPVFMILGQSAAVAAVHAIDQNVSLQKINYSILKDELLRQKQVLVL